MASSTFLTRIFGGKGRQAVIQSPPHAGVLDTATIRRFAPNYQLGQPGRYDHLNDLVESRQAYDSQTLLSAIFRSDPDTSAAVHGYLTLANTRMHAVAVDLDDEADIDQTRLVARDLNRIGIQRDYTKGYTLKEGIKQQNANFRMMLLLRGAVGCEVILDEQRRVTGIVQADAASLRWFEPTPGAYKPSQQQQSQALLASLDFPTFFTAFYRRNPTEIYTHSPFVAAINTLAARQGVINDLSRIMRITGYPRIDVEILVDVLTKSAPQNIAQDADALKTWIDAQMDFLALQVSDMSSDQAFVHPDSVKAKMLNEKGPGAAIDMSSVIGVYNAQNQAGLKTMSSIIGRGESGANTGSTEARLAAMFADELNDPLEDLWSSILTFAAHQRGFQGWVKVYFESCEMRPNLELAPQRQILANMLRQALSDGLITDLEYHLQVHGRLPPKDSPQLMGTGFIQQVAMGSQEGGADPSPSPNDDSLGRAIAPDQTRQHRANAKKGGVLPKPGKRPART